MVLFSLTVLTLIFGTSSARTLAHIEQSRTNALLSQRLHDNAQLAGVLLKLGVGSFDPAEGQTPAVLRGLTLQPATGLVDLNTASPALLRLLLEGYGLPDAKIREALDAYRTWRREGRKLLRVSDFYRVTGLTADMLPKLVSFATVYSGRTGVAADQAQLALLQHLLRSEERREVLVEQFDPALTTNGTMVNLHVRGEAELRAIVHLGGGVGASRVLELQ